VIQDIPGHARAQVHAIEKPAQNPESREQRMIPGNSGLNYPDLADSGSSLVEAQMFPFPNQPGPNLNQVSMP
jgi:hypothetical protein